MGIAKSLKSGLHALVWKEDKIFVAKCIEMEIVSQGASQQDSLNNLEEALELYFENEKTSLPKAYVDPQVFSLKLGYA